MPAHFKLISSVGFEREEGKYMVSTSYDGRCKVWNTHDWTSVVTLAGQKTKLSSANVSKDTKYIITTSFDRTMKLWERKSLEANANPDVSQDMQVETQPPQEP